MGGDKPQAAVMRYIEEGSSKSEGFFRRLAKTPASELPSSCTQVTITINVAGSGNDGMQSGGRYGLQPTWALPLRVRYLAGKQKSKWLIANGLAGGRALDIAARKGKGHIPWVGVAAQLPDNVHSERAKFIGEAFTFLPLGIQTGPTSS